MPFDRCLADANDCEKVFFIECCEAVVQMVPLFRFDSCV